MNPMQPYLAFARSYELKSFSGAALALGTSQSSISKQIASLEKSLGVQLFARSTRRLSPTNEAIRLYKQVSAMIEVAESLRFDQNSETETKEVLRIAMPYSYGRHVLCPLIPTFLDQQPHLKLEVQLTDEVIDLIDHRIDVAIRLGPLASSTLRARPLGWVQRVLVASAGYLELKAPPQTLEDLEHHACITYSQDRKNTRWVFNTESGRKFIDIEGELQINDMDGIFNMACANLGIALLPAWIAKPAIEKGLLLEVLPHVQPRPVEVNAVYSHTRYLSARARAFIDFLAED